MAKYTTQVRSICETMADLDESVGYASVNEVIANSREKIFDFEYPIYDETYKPVLETKILKHFYTREIGAETVGLWKLWLDARLNEVMPYYNQLYRSAMLEYNPLYDVDITTVREGTNGGERNDSGSNNTTRNTNGNNNTENNGSNWNYYSDTPQGDIDGLESNRYLTNATHDTLHNVSNNQYAETAGETGTNTLNSNYTNTEEYIEHVTGKRGGVTYSKMIEEYRKNILNIDLQVIHELDDLFLNLW